MNIDNDIQSNDLTQLSSREQLSALMDGALPEDQTRFLLRRLQHDAELAGSWDRWRTAGEVMRGLAPARPLSHDFARRVAAAIQADAAPVATALPASRPARWRSGVGIGALAAGLAVMALAGRTLLQPAADPAVSQLATVVPALPAATIPTPTPATVTPQVPTVPDKSVDSLAVASVAVAASARPSRQRRAVRTPELAAAPAALQVAADVQPTTGPAALLPQAEITTRPWPRSILPQYSGGNSFAVGFGEHPRAAAENPFSPPVFDAPPKLLSEPSASSKDGDGEAGQAQPRP